jgi:hypothetical protein
VIPVFRFPEEFKFKHAVGPDALRKEVPKQIPGFAAAIKRPVEPVDVEKELAFAGTLALAELRDQDWTIIIHPLYIVRIERVKGSTNGMALIRLILVDERFFWTRGVLRQWSYNRVRGDGGIALDSVKHNEEPFTIAEVAEDVVNSLHRSPELAVESLPERWGVSTPQWDFVPVSPAVTALAELVAHGGLVDPCLRWDGVVSLHRPGEGFVGYAENGKGPNTQKFPDFVKLDKRGTGQGFTIEAMYPQGYIVVVGGLTLRTVEIDNAEPVLMAGGRVRKLTEEVVRELTNGDHGIEWLKRWITHGAATLIARGLRPDVARLFAEQAWYLWRVKDVVVERGERLPKEGELEQRFRSDPGPNAHLLPLRDRAETVGGKQESVLVEAYRYTVVQRQLFSVEAGNLFTEMSIRERLARIRTQLAVEFRRKHPGARPPRRFDEGPPIDDARFDQVLRLLDPSPIGGGLADDFARMRIEALRAKRLEAIAKDLGLEGLEYEKTYRELLKARDKSQGSVQEDLFNLAKKQLEAAEKLRGDEAIEDLRELDPNTLAEARVIKRELEAEMDQIRDKKAQKDRETKTRAERQRKAVSGNFVLNLSRQIDGRARVVSKEEGVVKTSARAGWVVDLITGALSDLAYPGQGKFQPRAVKIVFGTIERPALDAPPPELLDQTKISKQFVFSPFYDDKSRYIAVFKRALGSVFKVKLSELPVGEGVQVWRPDIFELVPLRGVGNKTEIDRKAQEIAQEIASVPEVIEGSTHVLGRPWPVQCDGIVSSVTIRARRNPVSGTGMETEVTTGFTPPVEFLPATRTRVRKRPMGRPDGAQREGAP